MTDYRSYRQQQDDKHNTASWREVAYVLIVAGSLLGISSCISKYSHKGDTLQDNSFTNRLERVIRHGN